ncbi:MAG TPA: hypothetical protein VG452_10265 [Egibacteraceae bacterium]|nr:hypothetical protein [Egibacteraceae bacterium]
MSEAGQGGGPQGPPPVVGEGTPSAAPARSDVPLLAAGAELIGEYQGSGFKEPPYLARRADGQIIQLSRLLYLVADEVDVERDLAQIAERVSERFGRTVSADNVGYLVEEKLRPLGVLAAADGSSPPLDKSDPLLALRFRTAVIPQGVVAAITTVFGPLFLPLVVVTVLAAVAVFDVWLFFVQGLGQATRQALYDPATLVLVLGLVVASAAFHECGHATGCRYGGADPGVMGVGLYIIWPAFYTNVTDSYRLGKAGRLRTDLGGIYFNLIFVLATAGAYALTRFEPLLLVILVQHLEILRHFFPFVRLDGYYIVSDLTGVPDLFARMKPILRSLLPGRELDSRVTELKTWARAVVTLWVLLVVPLLAFNVALILIHLPRILATTYDSLLLQLDRLSQAFSGGGILAVVVGVVQLLALVLPVAGLALMFWRIGKRLTLAVARATSERPLARRGLAAGAAAAAAAALFVLWPNGDYRPLQEGERYTVQEAARGFRHLPSGRPALTAEREQELGGAPFRTGLEADPERGDQPTPTVTPTGATPTPSLTETETKTHMESEETETLPEATETPGEATETPGEATEAPTF